MVQKTEIEPFTAEDISFVDSLIKETGKSKQSLLPLLQGLQKYFRYLPEFALERLVDKTDITPSEITGVATFYSQFRLRPVGRHIIRVCHGTACHVRGAQLITDALNEHLQIPEDDDTDQKRLFTLEKVPCIGCCSLAPCMLIDDETFGRLSRKSAVKAVEKIRKRK